VTALRRRPTVKTLSRTWKSKSTQPYIYFSAYNSEYFCGMLITLFCSDYQAKPELDRYESEGLDDDANHAELNYQQRRDAERLMDQERMRQQRGRRAGAFMDDENEYSENEEIAR
jgi:hypothetical protein